MLLFTMFTCKKKLFRTISTFEKIKYVFNSYISINKPLYDPNRYISVSDNKKDRILDHVKKIETFEIRQSILLNELFNNVKYNKISEDKMQIIDLVWKYKISHLDILCAMYATDKNASVSVNVFASNPFNLPEFREISQVTYDKNKDSDWYKLERSLRNEYKKKINGDTSDGEIYRMYMGDDTRYIILRKVIDYDYTQLKVKIKPHVLPSQGEANTKALQTVILGEAKDPMRNYDKNVFKGIIEMAKKNKGYIGKIGNVNIQMIFDSIEFYDATRYNQLNGQDAFDLILIDIIKHKINFFGESSIVNQYTFDLISRMLTEVIEQQSGTISLRDKLYDDFISLTSHSFDDTVIEIGHLMDKYNIESPELFLEMFKMKNPIGFSWNEYQDNKDLADNLSLSDSAKILESHNYNIYKLYGKYIDNQFRRKYCDKQTIKISSYDYGIYGLFYKCIFNLMIKKQ